jgi:hypothetical protein
MVVDPSDARRTPQLERPQGGPPHRCPWRERRRRHLRQRLCGSATSISMRRRLQPQGRDRRNFEVTQREYTPLHRVQGLGVEVAGRPVPQRGLHQSGGQNEPQFDKRRAASTPRVTDQARRRAKYCASNLCWVRIRLDW